MKNPKIADNVAIAKRTANVVPVKMNAVLTFHGGARITVDERLTYNEHVRNARRLKDIMSVESADGSLQTFCKTEQTKSKLHESD